MDYIKFSMYTIKFNRILPFSYSIPYNHILYTYTKLIQIRAHKLGIKSIEQTAKYTYPLFPQICLSTYPLPPS